MRLADLGRLCVPVTMSPPQPRVPAPDPDPAPAAGARWGKASAFSWSLDGAKAAGARQRSVSIDWPDREPPEYMRIVEADLQVMAERVKVRDPENPETWIEIDRLTRMAFQYTTFPPKPTAASLQPSLTTCYDLAFALQPPDSEES